MTRPTSTDDGMTLVELLVSMMVLGIIIAPLALVVYFTFATAQAESQRTTDSSGAQLMSSFLVSDVMSADGVWKTGMTPTLPSTCSDPTNTILELQWHQADTNALVDVTYDVIPPGNGVDDYQLRRQVWSGGSCGSPTESDTLVQAIDSTALPTVTCDPTNCAKANAVTVVVNALSRKVHNSNVYAPYSFTLTATRRVG